ncbi:bifunctional homocysteine S-methyltransferase/methylenetetrahydrofolate reductase [Paenibacillus hemerocallicola]|uniref:Bifunctional homocysteine S-methyltransferase/methylenetetrahydrofolate reductase n=1 Tax=Paenibacillus hemerocallicola TaxID=1172614 RepID=A0A5C4TEX1_9BACL|nr:bifunctional homocysteine S-methyltransferase/methylenetetrahydrofolate reductase [Paenibacillus hemerocallicola]TNJ67206.1 bifunctional homocysteine S-methyltransferase/methylenetetrahydrofolate reductase [Paenibacillus hemerocallicola]
MKAGLRETLGERVLVGDGAMGTFLYQLGFPVGVSYEEYNLLKPDVIADVHKQYYDAGARLFETNTFSANREKLSKFGLENEVSAINKAGVAIARQAVGDDAYIVGAVGSIRAARRRNITTEQLVRNFQEQIEALLEGGADGLLLETFYDLEEMLIALRVARQLTELPVIGQFATDGGTTTNDGVGYQEAFEQLKAEGADILGFNCHSGPNGILRTMEKLKPVDGLPLSVFPNAGLPGYVDGKYVFGSKPDYVAENALKFADLGARLIGGCCGTTPEHIAAMVKALQGYTPRTDRPAADGGEAGSVQPGPAIAVIEAEKSAEAAEPSLIELVKQRHTVIVEWDTPRDLDIGKFMEGAKALQEAGVDSITMADNALAVTRMSNLPMGFLLKERLGARPLLHIACRDRNLIGTQSHLMGMHAIGLDHTLVITGDPSRFGDLPGSSSVYDMTSFEMIRLIKQLNEGIAFSGKPLKHKAKFIVAAAFNPNVKYLDKAVQRLEKKIEAGADFIMTQPVYDAKLIENVYESTKHLNVPIFIGLMPIVSEGNATFLHNEVPGIQLSEEVRKRMSGLSGEKGREMGVQIGKELLDAAMPKFNGIYIMTPMHFYDMSVQLTRYVWGKTGKMPS